MSKRTNVIVKKIYPRIEAGLSKNLAKYKRNLKQFIEARSSELYEIAPYTRIYFGQNDIDSFFKAIGVKENDVRQLLTETYYWNMNFNPRAAKDPFTVSMIMVIRYFILKHDKKNAEISAIYLAFSGSFYPSIHAGKFPKAQPIQYKHVMDYVVNNMLTQKFDLKREGSVFGAIRSICITWLNTYEKIFKDPDDEDVADLIQQLHGRIKSFMGNIASLYYEAYEKGYYISYDSDSEDQDNYRVADTDSLRAERIVEDTMNLINSSNVDIKLCKMASDKNVKVAEVQSIIETIQSDNANLPVIKELLRIIVNEYFNNSNIRDVNSLEFVRMSISAKPNTKNKNIIRQKQIIESWLDENSPNYRKRKSRPDTKSSYYKSVLTYYVLLINKSAK